MSVWGASSLRAALGELPRALVLLFLAVLASRWGSHAAAAPGPEEDAPARGRRIYTTGIAASGHPITATLVGGIEMPGGLHPCASCHGIGGQGGFEGGTRTPRIWWSHLTAPHGVATYLGGIRPPYTADTVARAVRDGLDSAGAPLDELMPRYSMGEADLADLLAYLQILETERAPGVDETTIRIGTLLPLEGASGRQGRAVQDVLGRYFETLNASGGIHGRRIELVAVDPGDAADRALAAAHELAAGSPEEVFAIVGPAGAGAAPETLRLLEDQGIPVLGPLTFDLPSSRHDSVFFVLPSFADQGRAGATFLARRDGEGAVALAREETAGAKAMAAGFEEGARIAGLALVVETYDPEAAPSELVRRLRERRVSRLVFLGRAAGAEALLSAARSVDWRPDVVASSVLLEASLDPPENGLALIAPPLAPASGHPGAAEFAALVAETNDDSTRALEMAAFAAAKLLVDALKRVGRDARRPALLAALREVRALETGVTPPLRYGPNRREGVRGALMIRLDGRGAIVDSDWVDVAAPAR